MADARPDPVLQSARREAALVLALWLAAMVYSVRYCYLHGYDRPATDMPLVYGFPEWIFWGVVAPWVACAGLSWAFAYFVMRDEDLGADADEPEEAG